MKSVLIERFREKFGCAPEFLAHAPGRIEFIGNHTDYNGGTVLGAAIDRGVWVALARDDGDRWRLASDHYGASVDLPAAAPERQTGERSWANYPLGVLAAFPRFGLRVPAGFAFLTVSNLPVGAGLSSSAALELSSALVFAAAAGESPSREILVQAARHAENQFVGVPCGILDQGVSGFGVRNHLVFLDCRGPRFATVPLPPDAHFWIFNTHTKHALIDGLYAARHRECMKAARRLGVAQLADVPCTGLDDRLKPLAPIARRRARHVIEEIARVDATVLALRASDLSAAGKLLTASHRSSQTLFENSTPELDFLVDALEAARHVHGARLSGGGFGGAVLALTSAGFDRSAAAPVLAAYFRRFASTPDLLHAQTGDGASLLPP
ncbi:MAG: galactokinase [Verrucomicrobia bacterium]|nr:galactokinase [Verrucomicrobiota bacterium]